MQVSVWADAVGVGNYHLLRWTHSLTGCPKWEPAKTLLPGQHLFKSTLSAFPHCSANRLHCKSHDITTFLSERSWYIYFFFRCRLRIQWNVCSTEITGETHSLWFRGTLNKLCNSNNFLNFRITENYKINLNSLSQKITCCHHFTQYSSMYNAKWNVGQNVRVKINILYYIFVLCMCLYTNSEIISEICKCFL